MGGESLQDRVAFVSLLSPEAFVLGLAILGFAYGVMLTLRE